MTISDPMLDIPILAQKPKPKTPPQKNDAVKSARSNQPPSTLKAISLDDKYDLSKNQVFLSGTQAIVRLLLQQKARDEKAGLETAGFVCGYRGSPLAGLDSQIQRAAALLEPKNIRFTAGLNEDLAATALWGTQQAEINGTGKYDGVFGLWYGKGPGVDRSGDVFRHVNLAGTASHGGVLQIVGDDHTGESSTCAHQSEHHLMASMSPVLYPANVEEIIEFGLFGYALSRYAGLWVAIKCVKDIIESTATVCVEEPDIPQAPSDHALPAEGLNIRPYDPAIAQDARLHDYKLDAVLAFLKQNPLDRQILSGGDEAKFGIVCAGKSYLDVLQALEDLDLSPKQAETLGIRLYKVGCVWPLEPSGFKDFAQGLDCILVVEEKRALLESQAKEILYGSPQPPVIIGKRDEANQPLIPAKGEILSSQIAEILAERLTILHPDDPLLARKLKARQATLQAACAAGHDLPQRKPYFCAGCPHNTSTKVPEGLRANAGVGCHTLVQVMDRKTDNITHMGAEGANWVGEAAFSHQGHIFQNIGDGTFSHSGSLALRFAVTAGVNMTYRILFNDAVAMTGGQEVEGGLTVERIAQQAAAEGVARIAVVADDPAKYPIGTRWPSGTTLHPRQAIEEVHYDLAQYPGVSVLIYDQTCAAELRRRRKRGTVPTPDTRVYIDEEVCDGCGDCSHQSNCVAIQPLETDTGRKRLIDQTLCNFDFSCLDTPCPALIAVQGAELRVKPKGAGQISLPKVPLPLPTLPNLDQGNYSILLAGIGGTGIITLSSILGMAAHLEGKGAGVINMGGLAQKGGVVFSHIRLAPTPEEIKALRVAAAGADLLLGCDLMAAGNLKALATLNKNRSRLVVNTAQSYPGTFTENPDWQLPGPEIIDILKNASLEGRTFVDATAAATALFGSSVTANLYLLGIAWQQGHVPIGPEAIEQAIRLNGTAVEANIQAFQWGRYAAAFPDRMPIAAPIKEPPVQAGESLKEILVQAMEHLTLYQDAVYASQYMAALTPLLEAEKDQVPGSTDLSKAAARALLRLMAPKDEYEVARLYSSTDFQRRLSAQFTGWKRLETTFRIPLVGRKRLALNGWVAPLLKGMAQLRRIRGNWLDPFAYTAARKADRDRLHDYLRTINHLTEHLTVHNHATAVSLAALPLRIKGYGRAKTQASQDCLEKQNELLQELQQTKKITG